MNDNEIKALIETLTLAEKVSLLSGCDAWQTQAIASKGIESIWVSDGPHGLRKEDLKHARQNGGHSVKATCFPPEAALACSWSTQLVADVGKAIAEECKAQGVSVLLGPGVNIKRSPMCGRNFEYYSEDPYLAGKLAAAMIKGVEGEGVGTSLKHFAVNNQETLRMSISAEVDERALNEVYLKPFEIAVKEGKPSTVMCSYNRVNGVYSSENKALLTDKLRTKWGFDGLVMSDWGAVSNRPLGVEAGLDLEMPSSGGYNDASVINAVESGALSQEYVDKACFNVLSLVEKLKPAAEADRPMCDMAAHHALAVTALEKSAVLLKNDGAILPLKKGESIVFIGDMAGENGRYQGCGSSIINAADRVDFLKAYKKKTVAELVYAKGYSADSDSVDAELEKAALHFAGEADKVVIFAGLTDIYETEGYDRDTMHLPANQEHIIDAISQVNENVVVVLTAGSPVVMPWLKNVSAVLYTALGGEGAGEATFDLLYGNVNPSGKLADTWPREFAETPCAEHWPMGPRSVTYNESIYVGYRYFDKACRNVLFPFGYGLSYTQFEYDALVLSTESVKAGDALDVSFTVKNTGDIDGTEIAQLYVGHNESAAYQPARELKAFARVELKAGEEKQITLEIPYESFAFYDVSRHDFVVETGSYTVSVGASSRQRTLSQDIRVAGKKVDVPEAFSRKGAYGAFACNDFDDADFYAIHTRSLQQNEIPPRGAFSMTTTLGQMRGQSAFARKIIWLAVHLAAKHMHFSTNEAVNKKATEYSVNDLPFKNIGLSCGGIVTPLMAQTLLDMCNGLATYKDLWRAWRKRKS